MKEKEPQGPIRTNSKHSVCRVCPLRNEQGFVGDKRLSCDDETINSCKRDFVDMSGLTYRKINLSAYSGGSHISSGHIKNIED